LKEAFQGSGMLWVQTIELDALDADYKHSDFISPITQKPVIPNEKFYKALELEWQAVRRDGQEQSVFDLVEHVRGKQYSIYAHTNPDPGVHNCQTMTEEIVHFCKDDKEEKKKKWGKWKKGTWAVGSTLLNLTTLIPAARLVPVCVKDLPKYMISKDTFTDEATPLLDDKSGT